MKALNFINYSGRQICLRKKQINKQTTHTKTTPKKKKTKQQKAKIKQK